MLRQLIACIRTMARRRRIEAEADEEMHFHLDMETQAHRSRGLSEEDARRAALRDFGGVTQAREGVRAARALWGESLWQDTLYAARLVRTQPGFSSVSIGVVALAVGVSTALFSVADATLLRPLPLPRPEQIVQGAVDIQFGGRQMFSTAAVSDLRRWQTTGVFSVAAAWRDVPWGAVIETERPERVDIREITEGYLALHGVGPALGRDFSIADTLQSGPPVVMVSHAYWQSRLGADPNVIGRPVRVDGAGAELVGVVPEGLYPHISVWRPVRDSLVQLDRRGSLDGVYGRLRPDISTEDAARYLTTITPVGERSSAAGGTAGLGAQVRLTSVLGAMADRYEQILRTLAAAVAFLVILACVNLASLLLARGATRHDEMSIRSAIGAGRLRLVRQLLTESVLLVGAGGLVGAFVAWLSLDALVTVLPLTLPPGIEIALNPRVLGAAAALTLVTGIIVGLVPALRLSRSGRHTILASDRAHARSTTLSRRGGQGLIAAEVALAVVLVVSAGLMIRSFARLTAVDLGFELDSVVAFTAEPVATGPDAQARYYPAALEAIRRIPGVAAAGAVDHFALGQSSVTQPVTVDGSSHPIGVRRILPGYFEALNVPVRGRLAGETNAEPAAAILNESAAEALFKGSGSGRQLTLGKRVLTVAGVVADLRHGGPLGAPAPELFVTFDPAAGLPLALTFVVRTHGPVANLAERLRSAAEGSGARAIVSDVRPAEDWFGDRVATPRHRTVLFGLLGGLGLVLAIVGVFGMTAYAVSRRTREIGVRMALGARPGVVVGQMVREAAVPSAVGLAAGLVAASYGTRVLQAFLFKTAPTDPVTFASAALVMGGATLLAAWLPARRAALVDPLTTLKSE